MSLLDETWKKVVSGVALIIASALCYWAWDVHFLQVERNEDTGSDVVARVTILEEKEEEHSLHEKEMFDMQQRTFQAVQLNQKYFLHKSGRCAVGSFGSNEEFIRLNRRADAQVYIGHKSVVITVDGHRMPVEIRGDFPGAVNGALFLMSQKAADNFGLQHLQVGEELTGCLMEPVEAQE